MTTKPEVGQIRVYREQDWTVDEVKGNEVRLHATDSVGKKILVRTKAFVKKNMAPKK